MVSCVNANRTESDQYTGMQFEIQKNFAKLTNQLAQFFWLHNLNVQMERKCDRQSPNFVNSEKLSP